MAASGSSEDVLPFVDLARAQAGSAQATILGFRERVSGPMARSQTAPWRMPWILRTPSMPRRVTLTPHCCRLLLSAAEFRSPLAGREFILAVATGCDLVCRMALSLRRPMESGGWYPPPILGGFGATAAVSRALR